MSRQPLNGGQQAALAAQERGIVQTAVGYRQFPWNIHPDDAYVRVFPDGPYDRQWAGIQKINLISSVGTQRASVYGDEPVYIQQLRQYSGTVQAVNQAAYSQGAGPAVLAAQEQAMAQSSNPPPLWTSILARLRR